MKSAYQTEFSTPALGGGAYSCYRWL